MGKHALAGLLLIMSLQATAQETPGEQLTRVGNNEVAWSCRGSGDKTVLLIAGMGLDARSTFKNVFRNVAASGYQVCHVRMHYAAHFFDEQDPWLVIDEIDLLLKRVEAHAAR